MKNAPPLAGIRVVEVGNYMAGPFCGMQLADLGADVVKVENPEGGDMGRDSGPFVDGESANFMRINRNKRSLALNLKSDGGKEIFRKLVARSDIVIENLRPGTMRGLGLDYPTLRAENPRLIYVAASGWGQNGPYAPLAGLDIMAQAMSGLMSITGEEGGAPVKIGVPMCDLVCALYGALAAVSALHERERTGRGQLIDVSLFEAGVSFAIYEAAKYFTTGEIPRRLGSAHQTNAPYQAVRSQDGYFTVGATSPKNWAAFCRVLGIEDLIEEPRFKSSHLRREHLAELLPIIEGVTLDRPSRWWVERLQEAGVPCAFLQDYGQVFNDPHLLARRAFVDAPHSKVGKVRQIASPMHFSETPLEVRRAGPVLGEDSADILAELGYACVPS
ncbi:MAG: CoA transferase [Candidatus Eremiobacteraeota bacterium]|nr:CoA transferase [Candidatus Eremiobacteraeota bacterium]